MMGDAILRLKGKQLVDVLPYDSESPYGYGRGFCLVAEDGTKVEVIPYSVSEYSATMKIRLTRRGE